MTEAAEPLERQPPVTEVALGVQFKAALPFGIVDLGVLADRFSDTYPTVIEQPPLPRAVELPDHMAPVPEQEFSLYPPRLWLVSADKDVLVQVQSDRFVLNWRRTRPESRYPGFTAVKAAFFAELERFSKVLSDRGFELPTPELCEITYVNHLPVAAGWASHADVAGAFNGVTLPALGDYLSPEDALTRFRYSIRAGDGSFRGRLHVNVSPAQVGGVPTFVLNLMGRIVVDEELDRTVDACHAHLRTAFDGVVTAQARRGVQA